VLTLEPGRGYLDAMLGASTLSGPLARLEAGWRLRSDLGMFGYGQWTPNESSIGVGARLTL